MGRNLGFMPTKSRNRLVSYKPKILLLFSSSSIGGAERSLTRMATYDQENRPIYFLATLCGDGEYADFVRSIGHIPNIFGNKKSSFGIASIIKVIFFLYQEKIDILYICGLKAAIIFRLLRFIYPSIKIVHGIRSSPGSNSRLDFIMRKTEKLLHPLTNLYITNSKIAANILIKNCHIPERKIITIYNGVENFPLSSFRKKINDHKNNIITIANLLPGKGHIEYLDIIQTVLNNTNDTYFYFIGRDDMNGRVQEEIKKRNLVGKVICTNYISNINNYLETATIMVLPSKGEGSPTSILESMSYQIPVIAYSVGGIPELINHDIDGYIIEPFNKNEMARLIIHLLKNPNINIHMGESGRKKIEKFFTIKLCAQQHDETLKMLFKNTKISCH